MLVNDKKLELFKNGLWFDEFKSKRFNLTFRMKSHVEFPSREHWNFAHPVTGQEISGCFN